MRAVRLKLGSRTEDVRLMDGGRASIGDRAVAYAAEDAGGGVERIVVGGRAHRVAVARDGARVFVWCDGVAYVFERSVRARAGAAPEHASGLVAPMPGRVRRVFAAAGETVTRGTVLLALEAMKMEHAIRAPRDGAVRRILVREGDLVDAGAELVELD